MYFLLLQQGYIQPGLVTAHKLGIPKGTFDPWLSDRERLVQTYLTYPSLRKKKKIRFTRHGKFRKEEEKLYLAFVYRRSVLKLPVSRCWLDSEFSKILQLNQPKGWEEFKYSNGWATGFCLRWRICSRAMTNKKTESVLERLPDIRNFHRYIIYYLPRLSSSQQCAKYGRFAASNRYHMDQIPMPFVFSGKRTLHFKGAGGVPIRHPQGSGLEKRQCTLQLTIRAVGEQNIKPILIFRGTGTRIPNSERSLYPPNIRVLWQRRAWADRRIMMEWLDGFDEDLGRSAATRQEVMLGMDQHGSQLVSEFLEGMTDKNIYGVYTPVNCTDVVAPIDHHVGARMKNIIKKLYVRDFAANIDQWTYHLSASQRRVYIANWVSEAWDELKTDSSFFLSVFQSTGFCNAQDGSENHLIKLGHGVTNYNINNI